MKLISAIKNMVRDVIGSMHESLQFQKEMLALLEFFNEKPRTWDEISAFLKCNPNDHAAYRKCVEKGYVKTVYRNVLS